MGFTFQAGGEHLFILEPLRQRVEIGDQFCRRRRPELVAGLAKVAPGPAPAITSVISLTAASAEHAAGWAGPPNTAFVTEERSKVSSRRGVCGLALGRGGASGRRGAASGRHGRPQPRRPHAGGKGPGGAGGRSRGWGRVQARRPWSIPFPFRTSLSCKTTRIGLSSRWPGSFISLLPRSWLPLEEWAGPTSRRNPRGAWRGGAETAEPRTAQRT